LGKGHYKISKNGDIVATKKATKAEQQKIAEINNNRNVLRA